MIKNGTERGLVSIALITVWHASNMDGRHNRRQKANCLFISTNFVLIMEVLEGWGKEKNIKKKGKHERK